MWVFHEAYKVWVGGSVVDLFEFVGLSVLFLAIIGSVEPYVRLSALRQMSAAIVGMLLIGLSLLAGEWTPKTFGIWGPVFLICGLANHSTMYLHLTTGRELTAYAVGVVTIALYWMGLTTTIPRITNVKTVSEWQGGQQMISQTLHFVDPDEDSYRGEWAIIESGVEATVKGGPLSNVKGRQRDGADARTGVWSCGAGGYSLTLQAIIIDLKGNRSAPYQYTVDCAPREKS